MNFSEKLQLTHSKKVSTEIACYLVKKPNQIPLFLEIFEEADSVLKQRAAWVFSHILEIDKKTLIPQLDFIIPLLERKEHAAVYRNILKVLTVLSPPKKWQGFVVHHCFEFLEGIEYPVALKLYSTTILDKISLSQPELKNELKLLLEIQYDQGSPGFKSMARKILKKMD